MENGVVCMKDFRFRGSEFGSVPVVMGGEDGGFSGSVNPNNVSFSGFRVGLSGGESKEEKE